MTDPFASLVHAAAQLHHFAAARGYRAHDTDFRAIALAASAEAALDHACRIPFGGMGTYGDTCLAVRSGEAAEKVEADFKALQLEFEKARDGMRRNLGLPEPLWQSCDAATAPLSPAKTLTAAVWLNLSLLLLFPLAWFAPLMRAAVLPVFGMDEISVLTGLQALWETDAALALVVTFLAVFAPVAKVIGMALVDFGLLLPRVLPVLRVMGKLAMADVFLLAIYIVLVKGAGLVTVETAWGLYLFTGCILASLVLSHRA